MCTSRYKCAFAHLGIMTVLYNAKTAYANASAATISTYIINTLNGAEIERRNASERKK